MRQVVYQLSNERQNIVTIASPSQDLKTEAIFQLTRSVSIDKPPAVSTLAPEVGPQIADGDRPIKIASLDGNDTHFSGLKAQQGSFEIVPPVDHPDLTWDPASHDVLAWGDVVAYGVDPTDLPIVIDRAMAVRELKLIASKTPQPIKVTPDDSLHRNAEPGSYRTSRRCRTRSDPVRYHWRRDGADAVSDRLGSLYTCERLVYNFPVRVREPFGSDQLIAVTSQQRMTALEQALKGLDNRKSALQVVNMMKRYAPRRRADWFCRPFHSALRVLKCCTFANQVGFKGVLVGAMVIVFAVCDAAHGSDRPGRKSNSRGVRIIDAPTPPPPRRKSFASPKSAGCRHGKSRTPHPSSAFPVRRGAVTRSPPSPVVPVVDATKSIALRHTSRASTAPATPSPDSRRSNPPRATVLLSSHRPSRRPPLAARILGGRRSPASNNFANVPSNRVGVHPTQLGHRSAFERDENSERGGAFDANSARTRYYGWLAGVVSGFEQESQVI